MRWNDSKQEAIRQANLVMFDADKRNEPWAIVALFAVGVAAIALSAMIRF